MPARYMITKLNAMSEQQEIQNKISFWQIVILVLSVYVLLALAAEWILTLPSQALILLRWIDAGICIVFILDFFWQLWRSANRLRFLKWGWIDLVSSIPFLPLARWGRLVRIARILKVLRSVRSAKALLGMIFQSRMKGAFLSVALATVVLIIVSSVAILICETSPDSNITTAGDALWWAFSTVTSVGYGDFYPVTLEGRLVAAVLMTAGVALFSTLTAYIVSLFIVFRNDNNRDNREILAELQKLRQDVNEALKKKPADDSSDHESEAPCGKPLTPK